MEMLSLIWFYLSSNGNSINYRNHIFKTLILSKYSIKKLNELFIMIICIFIRILLDSIIGNYLTYFIDNIYITSTFRIIISKFKLYI